LCAILLVLFGKYLIALHWTPPAVGTSREYFHAPNSLMQCHVLLLNVSIREVSNQVFLPVNVVIDKNPHQSEII